MTVALAHTIGSLVVAIIALLAAVYVQVHGLDYTAYIGIATGAGGYAAGNTVRSTRNGKH